MEILLFQSTKKETVINEERLNGTYRLSAYWFAKMTSEIPILLMIPTLSWLICYFMIGLPLNIGIFFHNLLHQYSDINNCTGLVFI